MTVTRTIAQYITSSSSDQVPMPMIHESKRTLLNLVGISLSASLSGPSRAVMAWVAAEQSKPVASIIGSSSKTSPANAALVNGYLAHLQDYDDTHFPTILHPTAPVWPAVLAVAEEVGASGRDTLASFALGAEIACRVALSIHPWHYDQGWHITGTSGVFGAVAGVANLKRLSADELVSAFGIAGTQAGGVREVFGTDSKAIHPAKAASNGVQATSLAALGLTGPEDIVGGRRGFWAVLSPNGHSSDALTSKLGEHWELANNGLKPYANGVVSHPLQDAVVYLRNQHNLTWDQVSTITAQVHPLVLELMNRPDPRTGLEGKFSFQHCAAAALVDGAGHDAQFSDERVSDQEIVALRKLVSAIPTEGIQEDEVQLTITLSDGTTLSHHVKHATGSPQNPMSDTALNSKFMAIATEVIKSSDAERLADSVWNLDNSPSVGDMTRLLRLDT